MFSQGSGSKAPVASVGNDGISRAVDTEIAKVVFDAASRAAHVSAEGQGFCLRSWLRQGWALCGHGLPLLAPEAGSGNGRLSLQDPGGGGLPVCTGPHLPCACHKQSPWLVMEHEIQAVGALLELPQQHKVLHGPLEK